MKLLALLLTLGSVFAWAADISGTWKGTAETQNGTFERTFVLKQDGTKLTGETTSERMGKSTITNGKVEGDDISFDITVKLQDNEIQLVYKGKISGDTIKFHVEPVSGGGFSIDYVAKRVS